MAFRRILPEIEAGQRFGKLVHTGHIVFRLRKDRYRERYLEFVCDCGKVTYRQKASLFDGRDTMRHCGCWSKEFYAKLQRTHGCSKTPTWKCWSSMRERCRNPKNKAFERYGARGITVCERWEIFENFLDDMGQRPSLKHSIDRIDNERGYEPGNCRWATAKEQSANRSNTVSLTYQGVTKTLVEWSEIIGIDRNTLFERIRRGYTDEQVLETSLNLQPGQITLKPGDRFGRLVCTGQFKRDVRSNRKSGRVYQFTCDCGKVIYRRRCRLFEGHAHMRSCGCYAKEFLPSVNTTHGKTKTPEYGIWAGMKSRCRSRERGIEVCDRWQDFENFLADMGPRPSPEHSIDRLDRDQGYEPGNCRWATRHQRADNRRNTVRLTFQSITRTLSEWAEAIGIDRNTLLERLRRGWTVEQTLTTPLNHKPKANRQELQKKK